MTVRNLILVLGDQLSPDLSSLRQGDPDLDRILMVEVMEEATYVRHHKKKIALIFSAMRHFAKALKAQGWEVDYVKLDDDANTGSFSTETARAAKALNPQRVIVTEPGEWRVRKMMNDWSAELSIPVDILEDDRFICSHQSFEAWASDRKQLRMEYFYREMRKATGLLMDGDKPVGGQWNFDSENRKPAKADLFMPQLHRTDPDDITKEVLSLVAARFGEHFGDLEPFWFAVTREGAEHVLDHFIDEALPGFGDYQDAMLTGERFLYHSLVSFYINCGLLDPLSVCRRVEAAYQRGDAPLNAAEGFIRQIIGWREYVRGIYWLKMPGYEAENHFGASRALPEFYWTADTKMHCLSAAITQTREEAYAHHIQRLMVTGNFALLAGVSPHALHEWYLAVYADAYEWVELPNTIGMSQFADGGLLASKPYAASGNYINKMSDYCDHCEYDVKQKTGPKACPLNPLYWDFLVRNRKQLENNPRIGRAYATWDRMAPDKRVDYLKSAEEVLSKLDQGDL